MKTNEGIVDRIARACIGLVLVLCAFAFGLTEGSIFGYITIALAGIMLLTAVVGFCPAYMLCGMNTCSTDIAADQPNQEPGDSQA